MADCEEEGMAYNLYLREERLLTSIDKVKKVTNKAVDKKGVPFWKIMLCGSQSVGIPRGHKETEATIDVTGQTVKGTVLQYGESEVHSEPKFVKWLPLTPSSTLLKAGYSLTLPISSQKSYEAQVRDPVLLSRYR